MATGRGAGGPLVSSSRSIFNNTFLKAGNDLLAKSEGLDKHWG